MKKYFIPVALFMMSLTSCSEDYLQEQETTENSEIRPFLENCLQAAYLTHEWMSEEGSCEEYECCWEYVPAVLRAKYEDGATLTIDEMESVISYLETSPSFIDTLAEYDEFVDLDYYREYGIEWFDPNYGYTEEDLKGEEE